MAMLTDTRRRFRVAAIVLASIVVLAALYLFMPVGSGTAEKWAQLNNRRNEIRTLEAQVRPLRDLPKLLEQSRKDISQFYASRLPSRYSTVLAELGRLAARTGVTLSGVQYENLPVAQIGDIRVIRMKAAVNGRYVNIARFINTLERNQDVFFLIDNIELSDEDEGRVSLTIQLETYLRSRTQEDASGQQRSTVDGSQLSARLERE